MPPSISEATRAAQQLKQEGRIEAAIAAHREIVKTFPASAVAVHNLADALADAGHAQDAERTIAQAMRMGLDVPESWLVRARAVQALGRLDEAETLFRETLKRRPLYRDALREFSQLIWMRTASKADALKPLDEALLVAPGEPIVVLTKARALAEMGDADAALRLLQSTIQQRPQDPAFNVALAQVALAAGEPKLALAAAEHSITLVDDTTAQITRIDALLAVGEAKRAADAADKLHAREPTGQHILARLAVAWRLLGDPRYDALYDYDAFVAIETLDTPPGWADLGAYLSDLAAALHAEHRYRTHPFSQSIKGGSQVANVMELDHPAARALAFAIDAPLRRYIAKLGQGSDPMRARNRGGYAMQGGWSIRMQAGGRHINHVHPEGWISSACYIETPPVLDGNEGFLKLGEPGIPINPLPAPERFVQPKPGRLVLFPSFMWHGTVPFATPGVRLSFAFDVKPAPAGSSPARN